MSSQWNNAVQMMAKFRKDIQSFATETLDKQEQSHKLAMESLQHEVDSLPLSDVFYFRFKPFVVKTKHSRKRLFTTLN